MNHIFTAHRVFIGLGANLASPRQRIEQAMAELDRRPGIRLVACSSLYQSKPVGFLNQPDFINAVALIETSLDPRSLLEQVLQMEREAGRIRETRFGPRTLDIDILLFDEIFMEDEDLILPHPRMHERAFVLRPLFEIAPDLSLPGRGALKKCLLSVADQHCERLYD